MRSFVISYKITKKKSMTVIGTADRSENLLVLIIGIS